MNKQYVIDRLKEPSTWRGLAFIAGAAGISVSPELIQQAGLVVMALLGLYDVVRGEKKAG